MYITYRMPGLPTSKSLWPFSPQSIPGLALWLDAADASSLTLDGSAVTAWRDKSGKGSNASGSGGLSYTAGEGITFNGSNGYFSVPGVANSIVETPFTVFVVEKVAVLPSAELPMGIFTNDPNTGVQYGSFLTCYQSSGAVTFGWYAADQTTSTTYSPGTTRMLNFNYTGSNRTILVNGTSVATESWTQNLITGAFTQPVIGRLWGTYYYNGTISELMLYTGNINTQQYQQVEGYLAQKWGLQILLPPTHPYFAILPVSTPPTSISGLSLWLDATDSSTKVTSSQGVNLVSIRDKSGSGNLWTPVTPNTINANSSINSRPALTLFSSGSTISLLSGTYTLTAGYNSTIFAVVRCNDGGISIFGDYGPSINAGLVFSGPSLEFFNAPDYDYYSNAYDIVAPSNPNFILCARVSATDSGSTYLCTVNGTEYSVDQPNTALASTGTRVITTSNTGPSSYIELLIGEILVYSAGFNMSQIRQVEGYLAWKWGIQGNLPSSHPYYYAPSAVQLYQRPVFQRIFQPVDISGCQLWLDAADASSMTFSSGTTVSAWLDKSGNGNNGTPNTEITWNVNGFGTSLPAMTFTNTQWFLGNVSITGNQFTAFCVFNMNSAASFYARVLSLGVSGENDYNNNAYICIVRLGGTVFSNYRDGTYPTIDIALDTNELTTSWVDGTTSYISQYGGTPTTIGSSGNFGVTSYAIGVSNNTADSPFYGYVAEVIVYNTALTLSQRQQVEAYLAWKWGLRSSLPSTHPGYILPSFSTTFTPKSLTGLQLWLDAADSSTVTGTSTVTSWLDKSGNGNNGTPISSGPTLVQNVQNGLPGITFPTTASIMLCGNILTGTNFSILAVIKYTSSGIEEFALGEWKHQYGSNLPFYKGGTIYATASDTTYGPFGPLTPADTSAFHMYSASLASSTSSPDATLIAGTDGNVATYTSTSGPNTAGTDTPFSVGGDYENITGYYPLTGYMCEVIVYNTALTLSQRQQVEGYLAWKWGLQNNLPSTHAYKKFRP